MPRIHLLDSQTANQIAAGEVIERPASVVKELVENALDAGARNIFVDIAEGGLALLRIADDGSGMSPEDALLAVQRHATSKLQQIEDLNVITTLGFRGEALPSITAVSKTQIITGERESAQGTKIVLEGGRVLLAEEAAASAGTVITVAELFYNTPARKKFMRSPGYEGGLIHELMLCFALSHPEVNFRLTQQNKEILNTTGINTIPELTEAIYGKDAAAGLIALNKEGPYGSLQAYITAPGYQRSNRKALHFFVNKRRVVTPELLRAVEDAYEHLLPRGRFPLAVIHAALQPERIDVNVHPSKLEIRFKDNAVSRELLLLLEEGLQAAKAIPSYTRSITFPPSLQEAAATQEAFKQFYVWEKPLPNEQYAIPCEETQTAEVPAAENCGAAETPSPAQDRPLPQEGVAPVAEGVPESAVPESTKLPPLRIIGQLTQTFVLAEGAEGLYLIDQHAAHERILFDRLLEEAKRGRVTSQVLLEPIPLTLTALEEETVINGILPLTDLGIILEHFGPRSYLLRAVPWSRREDPQDFFYELLEKLHNKTAQLSSADIKMEFLLTASCKRAIKAGQKLSPEALEKLLRDLNAAANPLVCPHGRPVSILVSHQDILKAFHRK
ncbi:MAG: DNA mismatch repair endonuclease MutL [Clostridia bacterium]|jgi:DNA mismatch repair protein MutL|nr:DNA mismatch repair endonuclease MutL [Clostridia bacterium]